MMYFRRLFGFLSEGILRMFPSMQQMDLIYISMGLDFCLIISRFPREFFSFFLDAEILNAGNFSSGAEILNSKNYSNY